MDLPLRKNHKLTGLKMLTDKKRVILVVGPTAVGKTRFAIELAKNIGGEIISADSRYLYRGMDVGTAKPTPEELNTIPHYMINVADPDEVWSLAAYQNETVRLINEILDKGKFPIIVGGTGQYIRALTEGWQVPEMVPNTALRNVLMDWGDQIGSGELHRKLAVLDTIAADFIDASNIRRTIRALEVIFTTGKRFSELRVKDGPAYDYWIIGLIMPRKELFARADERVDVMLKGGLVSEVKGLLDRGYNPLLPSMSAIGYKEVVLYLEGKITLDEARQLIKKNTHQFIRRQANWFKPTDSRIHWYQMDPYPLEIALRDLADKELGNT